MAGHVTVPIYPSLGAQSVRGLLAHCEPVACFIGAIDDHSVVHDAIPRGVLRMSFPSAADPGEQTWESIVASTPALPGNPAREPDDLATIIYTSGTTGAPKGAMHRFAAFSYFAIAVLRAFGRNRNERMVSYLPLAHIAERALVESAALFCGNRVFFVESAATFRADLRRARPTIFFSVPRLFLKFQQNVLAKVPQPRLDRLLRTPVVNFFVRRRILRELGLDCVYLAASGGAALPMATLQWFRSIGLNLVEGYGMTETGITHTPLRGRSHPGYVVDSVPGVETRISASGEVLIKSPMNMIGYYRDSEATRQAFTEDGFFHTGDLGELDADGWLKIIGRLKEQFKTSKGKYVSPANIEKLLGVSPDIEACCVAGEGMASPFAIVVLSQEVRDGLEAPGARTACEQRLQAQLDRMNAQLDHYERLAFIVIAEEPWTIANGILTPTMKLKRSTVEQMYGPYFENWRLEDRPIVWHRTGSSAGTAAQGRNL
jgi:long-chain acyl-CoA synthetase